MKSQYIARAYSVLFPPVGIADGVAGHPEYERFAIPHTFKPQLSFAEAVIAALGTFMRVFLGCLLFAVWGTYSLFAWSTIRNPLWRVAVELPLFLLFVLSFAALMFVIASVVRTICLRIQ